MVVTMQSMTRSLVFCVTTLTLATVTAAQPGALVDEVRSRFVAHAAAGLDEYQALEVVGNKAQRRTTLARHLGTEVFDLATEWATRDITVTEAARTSKAHLGILLLKYPSADAQARAQAALSRHHGVFANTEILTHFVTVRRADSLLVLSSETVLDDRVKSFLANAPQILGPTKP
jgi:hypothetical protein